MLKYLQCNVLFPRPYGGAYSHSPIPQLEQDVGMGHVFPPPPSPPPPPPPTNWKSWIQHWNWTYSLVRISWTGCPYNERVTPQKLDTILPKAPPIMGVVAKWLKVFCCLYLCFLYHSLHHHLLLKCLTLAPTTYMYVLVYSLLHIHVCDSMAGHWTTSPPCLQIVVLGHKEHEEPLAVSIPSHHWMENYSSLGSKFRSRLGGVVARMQHEVLTQSSWALSAGDDAFNNNENWVL